MGYLLLAILCSAMLSLFMRLSNDKVKGNVAMLAMNYVACSAVALAYAGFDVLPKVEGLPFTLGLGVINGFFYLAGFVLLQINVRRNGVVLSATFSKLGLLVPIVVSIALFNEVPAPMQIVGFVIAVAAIILINFEKDQSVMQFKAGLILLLASGGTGDTLSKVFEEMGNSALAPQFLFYTFTVALVLCLALMLYKKQRIGKMEALFGLMIGVPNFFSAKFLLASLNSLPAVIVYPTFSVGTILAVTLVGVTFFREKLGKRQWIAIAAILTALVLLNI